MAGDRLIFICPPQDQFLSKRKKKIHNEGKEKQNYFALKVLFSKRRKYVRASRIKSQQEED